MNDATVQPAQVQAFYTADPENEEVISSESAERREAYIPIPKHELMDAASADLPGDLRASFDNVCRMLAATLHYDFYETQEAMRRAYYPFDPDSEKPRTLDNAELDKAWSVFDAALTKALKAANFEEIDADAEARAAVKESESGVSVKTSQAGMRMIRHFVRNRRRARIRRRRLWGLYTQYLDADVFSDVVMVAGFKAEHEISAKERSAMPRASRKNLRPSCA
ncbi:MAG: hypothetical protein ABWZ40_14440, partial [Caulobacterales bacterium]